MFEMQVRCVWVILNNQVRVNFSTNCKCRHIYLSFSDHQIPSIRLPQSAGNGISETLRFQNFQGEHALGPPYKSHTFGARFSRIPRSETSHKNPQIHPCQYLTYNYSRYILLRILIYSPKHSIPANYLPTNSTNYSLRK